MVAAEPSDRAIAATNLEVAAGEFVILQELSIEIPLGVVYGLAGPTGAGKSSFLRVAAGLQPVRSGSMFVGDVDALRHPSAARRLVGYLPSSAGVYADLTVREHLNFYGQLYGVSRHLLRRSVDELLELFSLSDRADTATKWLTGSMLRQLGMARCLIHDPAILLLDEPWSGLDPSGRLDLREMLQELPHLGKTVVIASNDLFELQRVCTHYAILEGGRVAAESEAQDLEQNLQSLEEWYGAVMDQIGAGAEMAPSTQDNAFDPLSSSPRSSENASPAPAPVQVVSPNHDGQGQG